LMSEETYYQRNKARIREHYQKNKEQIREYQRKYLLEHPEKVKKYRKSNMVWREKNRDKIYEKEHLKWLWLRDDVILFLTGSINHVCQKCGKVEKENETFEFAHLTKSKWLVNGMSVCKREEFQKAPEHFLYLCHRCHFLFDGIVFRKKMKLVLKTDDDIHKFGWEWVKTEEEMPVWCDYYNPETGNLERRQEKEWRDYFVKWNVPERFSELEEKYGREGIRSVPSV
jgi:hypothetical protein